MTSRLIDPKKWIDAIVHGDDAERKDAAMKLGSLDPSDPTQIQPLIEALSSPNDKLVFWSVVALGRLGTQANPAVLKLASILRSCEHFGTRQAAILALSKVAPHESLVRETVLNALSDVNPFVRREAVREIARHASLYAMEVERIRSMAISESDETVAQWCAIAIKRLIEIH